MNFDGTLVSNALVVGTLFLFLTSAHAQRQMEYLGRGVVAVNQGDGRVFVSWRMLGTEPDDIAFNLYRSTAGGPAVQLTTNQTQTTMFIDSGADLTKANSYSVRAVIEGKEQAASAAYTLPARAPVRQYLSVPLDVPPGGITLAGTNYTYDANDCSVGDLDGDGEYEIVMKWEPTNAQNSAFNGYTGNVYLDAYRIGVTGRLWRIDLGRNIRAGATYTQFMVYDLDGDGKAEVACKTAPGTIDGRGRPVLMPGDHATNDYRNANGRILTGPEYLTIFDGQTGASLVTTNYLPARGDVCDWGDCYGQRVDQLLACVAYLDGQRPSLVMCRGYYGPQAGRSAKNELVAWNWRGGILTNLWIFEAATNIDNNVNNAYVNQGNHNLGVADVDGDGKDEIVYGACVIDDNGKGLYSTGWGHGDVLHVSDLDPTNPGLEVFGIQERFGGEGMNFRDARTGKPLFLVPSVQAATTGPDRGEGPGRGVCFNIDPRYPGNEAWALGAGMSGMYNARGQRISETHPRSCNFAVWWDGDLLRELLDRNYIAKWNWKEETETTLLVADDCTSNNGTKATPGLSADLFGDWREEVMWRTTDGKELRIYTTMIPTNHRLRTLMHDPQYRLAVAWQNVMYNQPPHPSFYLDEAVPLPPRPNITLVRAKSTQ